MNYLTISVAIVFTTGQLFLTFQIENKSFFLPHPAVHVFEIPLSIILYVLLPFWLKVRSVFTHQWCLSCQMVRLALKTGKRMCPPSLSCSGDMVVPSSFAPRLIAMVRAVPTMLRSHEHGKPMVCPKCSGTFAKPRLSNVDGSFVRPSGKGARGGKAPHAMSTTERERQLEAQVKDLQQQLAKPAPAAGQGPGWRS